MSDPPPPREWPTPEVLLAALRRVETIVSDDFCCDLEMQCHTGDRVPRLTPDEVRTAERKLGAIYRIVHSLDPAHSCHHVHGDWRAEFQQLPAPAVDPTVPTLCMFCGKTFAEHDYPRPPGSPVPKVPCLMLKSGFTCATPPPPREQPGPDHPTPWSIDDDAEYGPLIRDANGTDVARAWTLATATLVVEAVNWQQEFAAKVTAAIAAERDRVLRGKTRRLAYETDPGKQLSAVMNALADNVETISDEELLAEYAEKPESKAEAERTRQVMLDAIENHRAQQTPAPAPTMCQSCGGPCRYVGSAAPLRPANHAPPPEPPATEPGWLIEGLRDAQREADANPELRKRVDEHPSGFLPKPIAEPGADGVRDEELGEQTAAGPMTRTMLIRLIPNE